MFGQSRYAAVVFAAIVFSACGGGGNDEELLPGKQNTYTVGGTVSGLVITVGQPVPTVTLTNTSTLPSNIGTLVINGNSAFVFPAVPSGTEYKLAIASPNGYACTFTQANGNGTVNGAAITNLNIACTAGAFSIGGTVTGLGSSNSGLVLRSAQTLPTATQTLSITGDGPFTFVQTVGTGSNYSISIETAHSHYVCAVASVTSSGTVTANITNIAVTCEAPIRVTVSGLGASNSGLILSNSYTTDSSNTTRNVEPLSIAGDGTAAFPTRLPSGRQYAVSVSNPHANFNCVVNMGNGTVAATAVNIAIVCTPPSPMTVSGASPTNGTTSVLRSMNPTISFSAVLNPATVNSSSVTLVSSAGAQSVVSSVSGNQITITPTRKLLPLVTYTLNISTAVRGANGERLTAPMAVSFTTRDGTWQAPTLIERDNVGDAGSPQIAMDSAGNALAVWHQANGSNYAIQSNRFTATPIGGAWGVVSAKVSDSVGDAFYPQIRFDASNNALAVWYQHDGTRNTIRSNRYTATDGTWGTISPVVSDGTSDASYPQLAIDASGNALAVWEQYNSPRNNIWSNRYIVNSGRWEATTQMVSNGTGAASFARVAFDSDGSALAVWRQLDGTRYNVRSNRYVPTPTGGNWQANTPMVSDGTGDVWAPQIAIQASGVALAVWDQFVFMSRNIFSNRYTWSATAGMWGTPTSTVSGNPPDAGDPQIVIDSTGNALAVWWQEAAPYSVIQSNRYTANPTGGFWNVTRPVLSDNSGSAIGPQVAIDLAGNALAVWQQYVGARKDIWSNRYSAASGVWGVATRIESNTGDAANPQIVIDASGNALAVWEQTDGTVFSIWSSRFE